MMMASLWDLNTRRWMVVLRFLLTVFFVELGEVSWKAEKEVMLG